jgi:alpha-glucan, water dikinase
MQNETSRLFGLLRRILTDEGFRQKLLTTVAEAGAAVEQALGSAQDIEGVIDANGELTVVQTRPQM